MQKEDVLPKGGQLWSMDMGSGGGSVCGQDNKRQFGKENETA